MAALAQPVDLLLCDVDLPGLDFCAMAQDIRHGRLGNNPFTVLIATARPSTMIDLGKVFVLGIDYIVIKPMTADLVVRRVDGFTKNRKPFVVTEDFIGPNRRTKRRNDGSDDDITPVPNTLRVKVLHNDRVALMPKLLEAGLERLGKKKAEVQVKAIGRLTRRLYQLHQLPAYRDDMAEWSACSPCSPRKAMWWWPRIRACPIPTMPPRSRRASGFWRGAGPGRRSARPMSR